MAASGHQAGFALDDDLAVSGQCGITATAVNVFDIGRLSNCDGRVVDDVVYSAAVNVTKYLDVFIDDQGDSVCEEGDPPVHLANLHASRGFGCDSERGDAFVGRHLVNTFIRKEIAVHDESDIACIVGQRRERGREVYEGVGARICRGRGINDEACRGGACIIRCVGIAHAGQSSKREGQRCQRPCNDLSP